MPYFPTVAASNAVRQITETFLGYNHNLKIADGEFYDMKNLSSDCFPLLSTRAKRGVYASPSSPQGLIEKDALCYVDGTKFVINSNPIDMGLSTSPEDCPKQLISMGAYVIIMPDKKYINTADLSDFGNIEASYTSATDVKFSLCTINGDSYSNVVVSDTAPTEPANGDYWIDTSGKPHALKVYSETSSMWTSVPTTYIKIAAAGIGAVFKQYDGVTISGVVKPALSDLNNTIILWDVHHDADNPSNDYLIVTGLLDAVTTQTTSEGAIKIERRMPKLDFITESNNRLWGCRYGTSIDGKIVNEIYACKLGDFRNWNCFMGISTDSYVASCGTDGQFTGAITHLGYPLFFKENCLHKVYGNYPSNYQVQTTALQGVQKGCSRSLAIVNAVLYYKGRNGVCAYDGSLPAEMSSAFGSEKYSDAVAGAHHNKYYISMKDTSGGWHLFVYDSKVGLWHKEDDTHADAWCSCRNEMYFIDHADKKIKTILGSGAVEVSPIEWMAETGIITSPNSTGAYPDRIANRKFVSRMQIRMALVLGAVVNAFIQYDSSGNWEQLWTMTGTSLKTFSIPVRPRRCDHFKLKLVGTGECKIFSITKSIEQGSDEE